MKHPSRDRKTGKSSALPLRKKLVLLFILAIPWHALLAQDIDFTGIRGTNFHSSLNEILHNLDSSGFEVLEVDSGQHYGVTSRITVVTFRGRGMTALTCF